MGLAASPAATTPAAVAPSATPHAPEGPARATLSAARNPRFRGGNRAFRLLTGLSATRKGATAGAARLRKASLLLLLLGLTMASRGANSVVLGSAEGAPGDTVTIGVTLDNTDAISSLQLAVPLGTSIHYVEGSAVLTGRKADHAVSARETDGQLNLIVFSPSMAALGSNGGTLLTLRLLLGRTPETVALTPSKAIAIGTDGKAVDCEGAAGGSVTTRCAVATYGGKTIDFGRVPLGRQYAQYLAVTNTGNAPLTITGCSATDGTFSVATAMPLTIEAGASRSLQVSYTPTERGTVSAELYVACNSVSRLNTIALKARPYAVNELHLQPAEGISDSVVTMHVTMNNMDAITGLQMQLRLPAAVRYVDGSLKLSGRKTDQMASAAVRGDTLTAVAVSLAGNAFTGSDGEILSFQLRLVGPSSATVSFIKAILTATWKGQTMDVLSASYGAQVTIHSPQLYLDSRTVDLGRTSVRQAATEAVTLYNAGSAPLTIDRVAFSQEGLAVRETLPLTIAAGWQSATLTVATTDSVAKDVAATMRLYCNDPSQRMAEVAVQGSRYVTNAVTIAASDAFLGRRAELRVALDNTDAVKAVQMDIVCPHGIFALAATRPSATTARMGDMTVTTRAVGDTVKVRAFSLTGAAIAQGSGDIFSVFLDTRANIAEGEGQVRVANIRLGRSATEEVHSDVTDPTATVAWLLLGDVNADGKVDIADASAIASRAIGTPPAVFRERTADVNQDAKVDIADASALASGTIGGNP